eukprot:Sspe_Gene.40633::Locus_19641_Transcript_1_1_Confidence_1.000_Length_1773::g.40633::m.40633
MDCETLLVPPPGRRKKVSKILVCASKRPSLNDQAEASIEVQRDVWADYASEKESLTNLLGTPSLVNDVFSILTRILTAEQSQRKNISDRLVTMKLREERTAEIFQNKLNEAEETIKRQSDLISKLSEDLSTQPMLLEVSELGTLINKTCSSSPRSEQAMKITLILHDIRTKVTALKKGIHDFREVVVSGALLEPLESEMRAWAAGFPSTTSEPQKTDLPARILKDLKKGAKKLDAAVRAVVGCEKASAMLAKMPSVKEQAVSSQGKCSRVVLELLEYTAMVVSSLKPPAPAVVADVGTDTEAVEQCTVGVLTDDAPPEQPEEALLPEEPVEPVPESTFPQSPSTSVVEIQCDLSESDFSTLKTAPEMQDAMMQTLPPPPVGLGSPSTNGIAFFTAISHASSTIDDANETPRPSIVSLTPLQESPLVLGRTSLSEDSMDELPQVEARRNRVSCFPRKPVGATRSLAFQTEEAASHPEFDISNLLEKNLELHPRPCHARKRPHPPDEGGWGRIHCEKRGGASLPYNIVNETNSTFAPSPPHPQAKTFAEHIRRVRHVRGTSVDEKSKP